ncbi:hypothetical protein BaRGS_00008833 [Batillaria attramentaria]|uniref:Uncharacterized protein n=1 Tax=Batillaria attramentaria TaxID=370345 RepID=A0ABD0LKG7_9CAEN
MAHGKRKQAQQSRNESSSHDASDFADKSKDAASTEKSKPKKHRSERSVSASSSIRDHFQVTSRTESAASMGGGNDFPTTGHAVSR